MENTVQQIEASMKQNEEAIKDYEAMERLLKNRDFKRIFINDYIKGGSHRYTTMLGHPNVDKAAVFNDLQAIGFFSRHIDTILMMGRSAQKQNEAFENDLAEQEG